jgi:opacity protein-like surface antigen
MKQTKTLAKLALFAALASLAHTGHAQAVPTATRGARLSAFGGLTGTYTNLEGGKNGSITAGADLTFLAVPYLKPSFEIRGTYPVDSGHISSQKSFLLGPKVEHQFGRFHPYADFFIGRGGIDYLNGGFLYNGLLYISSSSVVYSPGAGLDFDLSDHWAVKADFQYQHWDTPVIPAGTLHPKATTFAVVYRFAFSPRHHRNK